MTPSPGDARNEDVTERAVYVWGVLTISNVGIWLINDGWLMIDDNILFFGFTRPGKRLHNYGKSPFSMGKSTINRQFYFNSYVIVYQRISTLCILGTIRINLPPPTKRAPWTCKTGILPAKTVHFSRCNYILPTKNKDLHHLPHNRETILMCSIQIFPNVTRKRLRRIYDGWLVLDVFVARTSWAGRRDYVITGISTVLCSNNSHYIII